MKTFGEYLEFRESVFADPRQRDFTVDFGDDMFFQDEAISTWATDWFRLAPEVRAKILKKIALFDRIKQSAILKRVGSVNKQTAVTIAKFINTNSDRLKRDSISRWRPRYPSAPTRSSNDDDSAIR